VATTRARLLDAAGGGAVLDAGRGWLAGAPRDASLIVAACVGALAIGFLAAHKPLLAVGAVVLAGLVAAVLVRPAIGGYLLVAAVPVLSGLRPGLPVAHLRPSEVLIGTLSASVLAGTRRDQAVPWRLLDRALLGYAICWAGFGTYDALRLHESIGLDGWGTVLGQLQFVLLYRAVRVSLRSAEQRRAGLALLLAASVLVSMLAVLQQFRLHAVDQALASATASNAFGVPAYGVFERATGPFPHWSALAGYLFPVLVVAMAMVIDRATRYRWLVTAALAVGSVALLLTAELSAIACSIIAVVVLGAWSGKLRQVLRALVIGGVLLGVLAGPFLATRIQSEFGRGPKGSLTLATPQTIAFRLQVWGGQYLPAIAARPLAGYGVVLPTSVTWPYSESQYVTLLMEGGIPLLLVFVGLQAVMLAEAGGRARKRRTARLGPASGTAARSAMANPDEQLDEQLGCNLGRALVVVVALLVAMDTIWPFLSNGGLPQVLWCLFGLLPASSRDVRSRAWR
jgi:hypothetical protein